LVALIAFTPLAFGTVEPWAIALMQWGIVSLVLVFVLGRLWAFGPRLREGAQRTGLELPIGLFIVFCLLQTVPLPLPWLAGLSPGSARMYQAVGLRGWAATEGVEPARATMSDPLLEMEPPSRRPVSVHPGKTLARTGLLGALSLLFFLVVWWCDRESRILCLLKAVTVVGSLVAGLGLLQYLTWNGKIYWVRRVPPAAAFGPFVNHNHFAGYVEMVIPVAISLVFYLVETRRRPGAGDDEGRWGKAGLTLFATVLLVVSLVLCMSRGGILSMLVSGLVLFTVIWRRIASMALKWSIAVALPLLATSLLVWIGADVVKEGLASYSTLGREASFRLRLVVWEHMARNIADFRWVGSGLGTFEESFASVVPAGSASRWDKAHNDYLQLLWETGLVGGAIVLAGTGVFLRRYWWPALTSSGHSLDLFRVGTCIALLSIALHSLVDFNLQIGANGFLFVLLAGVLVALREAEPSAAGKRPVLLSPPARGAPIGIAGRM
jgi:O-antigen ligase